MAIKMIGANTLKAGSFINIDGVACKVTDTTHSKSGKHGSAKCRIQATGLLDGRKREIVVGAQENVEVPIIEKKTAQVMSVSGNTASVMDLETYETFDLDIPDEFKAKVVEGVTVLYWGIMGTKVIKQVRGAE